MPLPSCSLFAVIAYTYFPIGNTVMLVLGFPLGFFASGSFSPIGAFFTELFPTRLRGSGQGFSYNVGRGIGALFPTLVGYLGARMGLGHAIAFFAAVAYLTMVIRCRTFARNPGPRVEDALISHIVVSDICRDSTRQRRP